MTKHRWPVAGGIAGLIIGVLMAMLGQDYEVAQVSVPVSAAESTRLHGVDSPLLSRQVAIAAAANVVPVLTNSSAFRSELTRAASVPPTGSPPSIEIFAVARTNEVAIRVAGRDSLEAKRLAEAGAKSLTEALSGMVVGPITIGNVRFASVTVSVEPQEERAVTAGPWGYQRGFFPFIGVALGLLVGWLAALLARVAVAGRSSRVSIPDRSAVRGFATSAARLATRQASVPYVAGATPRFRPARRDLPLLLVVAVLVAAAAGAGGRFFHVGPIQGYFILTALICAAGGVILLLRAPVAVTLASRRPWLVATLVWALCSVAWSVDPWESAKTWLVVAILLGAGLVLPSLALDAKQRWNFPGLLLVLFTVFSGVSLMLVTLFPQWGVVNDLVSADGSSLWNVGLYGWNAALGVTAALAATVAFGALAVSCRSPWLWGSITINVVAVLVSQSATSLVAMLTGVAVMAMIRWRKVRLVGALGMAALAAALLVEPRIGLLSWVFEILGRSADLTGRLPIWHAVLERTESARLSGLGMGNSPDLQPFLGAVIPHSHNGYLQIVVELGVVGAILFGAFLVRLGRDVATQSGLLPVGVMTFLLVANIANNYSLSPTVLALMIGWLASLPPLRSDPLPTEVAG